MQIGFGQISPSASSTRDLGTRLGLIIFLEVFEAVQHILKSRAGWKVRKRDDVLNHSQVGIITFTRAGSEEGRLFSQANSLHDWKKS